MATYPPPLTNLLIAMSHSPELQQRVYSGTEDEALIAEFGVTKEQLEMLRRGDLNEINTEVQNEPGNEGTGAGVTAWITVARWITTAADTDDGDQSDDSDSPA